MYRMQLALAYVSPIAASRVPCRTCAERDRVANPQERTNPPAALSMIVRVRKAIFG